MEKGKRCPFSLFERKRTKKKQTNLRLDRRCVWDDRTQSPLNSARKPSQCSELSACRTLRRGSDVYRFFVVMKCVWKPRASRMVRRQNRGYPRRLIWSPMGFWRLQRSPFCLRGTNLSFGAVKSDGVARATSAESCVGCAKAPQDLASHKEQGNVRNCSGSFGKRTVTMRSIVLSRRV